MIEIVNEKTVPVWLNVRETPIPAIRALDEQVLGERMELMPDRRVYSWNKGFMVRTVLLAPDGETVLNPQPTEDPMGTLDAHGHFPYAQVETEDFLPMLEAALARHAEPSADR